MTTFLWSAAVVLILIAGASWWIRRTATANIPWDVRLDAAITLDDTAPKGPPIALHMVVCDLPYKMYVDVPHAIKVTGTATRTDNVSATPSDNVAVDIALQSVAFEVDSERIQPTTVSPSGTDSNRGIMAPVNWTITATKSGQGSQPLVFKAFWRDDKGISHQIAKKEFSIRVLYVSGISQYRFNQITLYSMIIGVACAIVAIALQVVLR